MTDYLKDYKIVPKSHTFEPNSIKFNTSRYQLIEFEKFLFCVDKESDLVFKFKNESPYRTDKIYVCIMKKNRVICEHFYFVPTDLKHRMGTQIWQWFEHFVFLVQTSFYVLLDKRERNDVVTYFNNTPNSTIRVQVADHSRNCVPHYVFVSLDIFHKSVSYDTRSDIFLSQQPNADDRLMRKSHLFSSSNVIQKLVKRYTIKQFEYSHSLNKDAHYYEINLTGNNYERMMVLYDMKKKMAKFTSLTYRHGEPVLKKRNIAIEPDENFHHHILHALETIYLRKHPSDELISHFNDWHMDISNGLEEDHLAVLEMFEI